MSTIATGVFKKVVIKKQSAKGTLATGGAATGQSLRRVSSNLDLKKPMFQSAEINPTMQRRDARHGVRAVEGTISGEISAGTYQGFIESLLRSAAVTGVNSGALTNVTAAVTVAPAGTFTRAAGSWLTDGFKVGDVVRCTGWTVATANNAHNFIITALTATVMTVYPLDGVALVAKASGDSVTITVPGKKVMIPQTGHTRDYWTIEHIFADIVQSELFRDCVINTGNFKLPPNGMATVDFGILGLNMTTNTSAYFTSPNAPSTGRVFAGVNGGVWLNGVKLGTITNFEFNVNGNMSAPGGVVGSNEDPDIFPGMFDVGGSTTIFFEDATARDLFLNETEFPIFGAFTTANTPGADFMAFNFPRVKANEATKDDNDKGLSLTFPFTALENTAGGTGINTDASTIIIQDSQFA